MLNLKTLKNIEGQLVIFPFLVHRRYFRQSSHPIDYSGHRISHLAFLGNRRRTIYSPPFRDRKFHSNLLHLNKMV